MSARIVVLGGEPHLLTVTRDVEDWKKAEQARRESEEKYRTLFEESIDAVILTTRDGILEDVNQAFLDLFGFTREETKIWTSCGYTLIRPTERVSCRR